MKTWMISIFGISLLAFSLSGCGEAGSSSATSLDDGQSIIDVQQNVEQDTNGVNLNDDGTNKYGISSELGTPPELPFS